LRFKEQRTPRGVGSCCFPVGGRARLAGIEKIGGGERLGSSGIEKMVTFDQSQSLEHWLTAPRANAQRERSGNIPE